MFFFNIVCASYFFVEGLTNVCEYLEKLTYHNLDIE
jgi:hypothetical protein